MPYSAGENREYVRDFVSSKKIKNVLDIGPGSGTYSEMLADLVREIDCVEIWTPYIDTFDLHSKYRSVYNIDARVFLSLDTSLTYDLVIFGDVLEHMTQQQALTCWSDAARIATWGMISVPIVHYPQGEHLGNPHEAHVQEHITPESVREVYGPIDYEAVYDVTGTFIKRFV